MPLNQKLKIRATDARESVEIIVDEWKDEVIVATLIVRSGGE